MACSPTRRRTERRGTRSNTERLNLWRPKGRRIRFRSGRHSKRAHGSAWTSPTVRAQSSWVVSASSPFFVTRSIAHGASDARWVESHLRPLIGLESETALGRDRRGEAFAAWRRYLEALAEQRPLVLVFEDLHWADEGLLDFVDELIDWLSGVPLLILCSARPELLERRQGWGGGTLNASTVGLSPLSEKETAVL